jgi:hypothetical protein
VVAFGRGGAVETVLAPGGRVEPTGVLFAEQSAECLVDAIERFENQAADYAPAVARRQALRFHPRRFDDEITHFLSTLTSPAAPTRRAA